MESLNRRGLLDRLAELGVKILVGKKVIDIGNDEATVSDVKAGKTERIHAEQIVIAMGAKSVNRLAAALETEVPELYLVGDCIAPRMVIDAVYEGSLFARRV